MAENNNNAIYIFLVLCGVVIYLLFTVYIQSATISMKELKLNISESEKAWVWSELEKLSTEYRIVHSGEYMNLKDCNWTLWVKFNETGDCLRPLNQLNDSKLDSIHNYCNQDILVHCER